MGKLFYRGNKWGITYVDPDGKQVRKIISEFKEAAQLALKRIEVDLIEGTYLDKRKVKAVKFEKFIDEFVSNYVILENRHPKAQMGRIKVIKEEFKGCYLHRINPRMIRSFLAERRKALKPGTVNRYLAVIKCMFNRAIDWGMLNGKNPASGISKLAENNERECCLTEQEQAFLLSYCHGVTRLMVLTALQTGMRWNEIAHLKWASSEYSNYVNFDDNVIVVHSSNSKSKKARKIPLSYALQCELFDLKKASSSEYVFVNPNTGRPFNNIRRSFKRAAANAGLPNLRFHDLRHVFASNLVRKNVSIYVVQDLLGHSTIKMTQRYAHIRSDQLQNAIAEIDFVQNESKYDVCSTSSFEE